MRAIYFYTNCTQSKSVGVPVTLSLAKVKCESIVERFSTWRSRLDADKCEKIPALSLYSGGHWSVLREIHRKFSKEEQTVRCRVISAGYGLLDVSDKVCPYAATFAPGHSDSISPVGGNLGPKSCRAWWKMLAAWKPEQVAGPRSFSEMFHREPRSLHLFSLSPAYLDAISDDLLAALDFLPRKENLIIISSGKYRHGRLNECIIPSDARLQSRFGGALASLNIRLSAEVICQLVAGSVDADEVRQFITRLSSDCPPPPVFNRKSVEDSDVSRFIERALKKDSHVSYTPLLRQFRDTGNACEMKRFKIIYENTKLHLYAKKNPKN